MKRTLSLLLTVFCTLSLCACGTSSAEKQFLSFSKNLSQSEEISFRADVRAEYETKTARFTLRYDEDSDGAAVTVLAPELIAGVTAHIDKGSTTLNYDTVVLDTGMLDSLGLSPMSSLPLIVKAMKTGYVRNISREKDVLAVEVTPEDGYRCTLRFSQKDMRPLSAQLVSGNRVTVHLEFSDWMAE